MFRLSMRELLVATALVAIAAAWWIDRSRIAQLTDECQLWQFRAETAAKVIKENGDQMAWEGEAVVSTHIDASGRRFQRVVQRHPRPLPAMTKVTPATPVQAMTRRNGNKAVK
jgi:hypothetical protein